MRAEAVVLVPAVLLLGVGPRSFVASSEGRFGSRGVFGSALAATPEDTSAEMEATSRVGARRESKVTEGAPSRWSNRGAMVPIESEVPILSATPLPARNVPVAPGVETPGQALTGSEELLSARLSLGAYRLSTNTLDQAYCVATRPSRDGSPETCTTTPEDPASGTIDPTRDYDIEFLRVRATMAYERIGRTDFGARFDLEYRPRISGSRLTDKRINELYLSYGLTDFRRNEGPSFGLAVGRVAIREAGYAQADGAALRLRILEDPAIAVGVFGGVSGNPYGYNWALRTSELFSTRWITGGVFGVLRMPTLTLNAATVATFARLPADATRNLPAASGIERVYVFVDGSYLITSDLNLAVTGWINAYSGGEAIQRIDAVLAYNPTDDWAVSLSAGRWSTILYAATAEASFEIDPLGNRVGAPLGGQAQANDPILDEEGRPIVPFDAALYSAVYNHASVRAGYRPLRELELFARTAVLLRDTGATRAALAEVGIETPIDVASLRVVPSLGARLRHPRILDASVELTYVHDEESQADGIVSASIGRGLVGFYLGVDGRLILGAIKGTDVGLDLSYTFPRDWFVGSLLLHGTVRYFEERVPGLTRPTIEQDFPGEGEPEDASRQRSWLGFAGLEWRL